MRIHQSKSRVVSQVRPVPSPWAYLPFMAAVFVALSLIACSPSPTSGDSVSAREVYELIQKHPDEVLVLDVRTPQEVAEGTVPGAVVMNFYDTGFKERLAALDRGKTILVYCHSGGRSAATIEMLRSMGFADVRHMGGGIIEWLRENLPLVGRKTS